MHATNFIFNNYIYQIQIQFSTFQYIFGFDNKRQISYELVVYFRSYSALFFLYSERSTDDK